MNGRGIDRAIFPQRNVTVHGRCWDYASEDGQYLVLYEPRAKDPWMLFVARDGYPVRIGDYDTADDLSKEAAETIEQQRNRLKPQQLP